MRMPGLTAHVARTVNQGGRFVAGVGAGWYEPEHRAFGLRLPTYEERVAGLVGTLDALDALGGARPPVLCGGTGAAVLELAAHRADAWNVAWDVPAGTFAALNARLDDACDRAGRDPRTLARTVGVTVLVAEDERGLDRAVERLRGRAPFLRGVDRGELAERIVCGTPQECVEKIAAYRADEVIAALLLRDDLEMVRLFGERVARPLRGWVGGT
jgi:alkanesulfonate monooxygenase SsuD/methylene tetrahydromethanopterin reductase-like flavin-dependent oxidoreductase (luciferase family)